MKITTSNYADHLSKFNVAEFPPAIKNTYDVVNKYTNNGKDWNTYNSNENIKRVVDKFFDLVEPYVKKESKKTDTKKTSKSAVKKVSSKMYEYEGKQYTADKIVELANTVLFYELKDMDLEDITDPDDAHKALLAHEKLKEKKPKSKSKKVKKQKLPSEQVEKVDEGIVFIKRFISMNGKVKTDKQVLNLLNGLQKAILERRIRKDHKYSKEIEHVQESLIKCYNRMGKESVIEIHPDTVERYQKIASSETRMISIALLKRFVGLQGKYGVKEKAAKLTLDILNAMANDKILPSDKYAAPLENAVKSLKKYTEGETKTLLISEPQLNGLRGLGILSGYAKPAAKSKRKKKSNKAMGNPILIAMASGYMARKGAQIAENEAKAEAKKEAVEEIKKEPVTEIKKEPVKTPPKKNLKGMRLGDVADQTFEPLGLEGKFLELIGNACKPTHVFVYGTGGSGKSSFAVLLSIHLNNVAGARVAYVAGEQFASPTFQSMIKRLGVNANDNFRIYKSLKDFSMDDFDVVVFDSKDSLGIDIAKFRAIKNEYPLLTTITTSQGKKDGNFRGSEEWRNEVDTMIKCEFMWAKTSGDKNRWGGRGLMKIE